MVSHLASGPNHGHRRWSTLLFRFHDTHRRKSCAQNYRRSNRRFAFSHHDTWGMFLYSHLPPIRTCICLSQIHSNYLVGVVLHPGQILPLLAKPPCEAAIDCYLGHCSYPLFVPLCFAFRPAFHTDHKTGRPTPVQIHNSHNALPGPLAPAEPLPPAELSRL